MRMLGAAAVVLFGFWAAQVLGQGNEACKMRHSTQTCERLMR